MNLKVKEWLKRYVPANIFCTVCTLIVAYITFSATHNRVLTAFLSSIIGTICFYLFLLVRDVISTVKKNKSESKRYSFISFLKNIRNLAIEFGFSEILDVLVVMPLFMYIFPLIIGDVIIGTLVAKIVADIVFYVPTIIAYELRKKHLKD
jgi:hypothetical protein